MRLKAIAATTKPDRLGEVWPLELLEALAKSSNGDTAIPFILDHDVTTPPLGKVLGGAIEEMNDGHHRLVNEMELFEGYKEVLLPDGTALLAQEYEGDTRPFAGSVISAPEVLEVGIDPINFESLEDQRAYFAVLDSLFETKKKTLTRKSLIPDPTLVVTLSGALVVAVTGKRVVEKIADKILDPVFEDLSKVYPFLRRAVVELAHRAVPKNRPITYVFSAPGDPVVELVARTARSSEVLAAITEGCFEGMRTEVESLRRFLGAVKVQFLLIDGKWELNYLLTSQGGVIGTPASFDRRSKRYKELDLKTCGGSIALS